MNVLSIVLTVFRVILLGGVLTRAGFLSVALIGELNRLTYGAGLRSADLSGPVLRIIIGRTQGASGLLSNQDGL